MATVAAVSVVSAAAAPDLARQQAGSGGVRLARALEYDRTGVESPVGLAYAPSSKSFYVTEARPGATPAETDVVRLTPFELSPASDRAGSARIAAAVKAPINVAFDARGNRLILLDNADRLLEVKADANGDLDPRTLVRRDALRLDLRDPQGMAVDPASGVVFILDAGAPGLVRVEPAADGSFDAATTSFIDLGSSGVSGVRGLAFDPATGHLHLGSAQGLIEFSATGVAVTTRDLSGLGLAKPEGMAFAPSGDLTDASSELSMYVADSGGAQSSGQIMELSLALPAAPAAIDSTSALVNTVNMATLSPPSPDPSGITYVAASDRLVISDGEVEETVQGITHFQGTNVWELNRSGGIQRTANISNVPPGVVVPVTNEPAGAAFNPNNGHYYFSADDGKEVFDVNPGADGLVGTAGDTVTSFDTLAVGNSDPEGITYNTFNGRLYVADGVNREVYEYETNGTLVSHFDVLQYGVNDPESVEFNPDSGTLFTLSQDSLIVETTTGGALLQTIDVSASGGLKHAGLAYAPASSGLPNVKSFYVVDRGIDNNADPNIVDGKLFELSAPTPSPPTNTPPVVSAGADQAVTLPASANLDGDVSDDGNPMPTSLTTTWTQVSGPSTVTFGNASAIDTTASVPISGIYVVRLTASDGQFSAFDEATLTFSGSGSVQSLDVPVTFGTDDAEESTTNVVLIGNADLDMMTADETNLVVGTRFRVVALPPGASISNAYVQFTAEEAPNSQTTSLTIRGQAAVNPPAFAAVNNDLSSRPTTAASATWTVDPWLAIGDAGLAQRSSNLAGIIQEIVSQPGWASGNALVLLIRGSGTRVAESFNKTGTVGGDPLLHVEYTTAGGNSPPQITSNGGGATASVSAAENQTSAADVDATDPNAGDTLTYSISGGADSARFAINSSSGVLTFLVAPNFELPTDVGGNNVYDVTVSVSDGNGGSDSQAIAVTVLNVNEFAPVITSNGGGDTASVSAAENQTAVTTVTATDGDNDPRIYSIIGGADAAAFAINSSSGVLTFVSAPDFELPTDAGGNNIYDVIVEASDGSLSDTQAIAVTVTDVVEGGNSPPSITSNGGGATASVSAAENQTAVTDVDATDPDLGDTLTYSITAGADMTAFLIVPSTGVLTFLAAPNFELPTDVGGNNVYDVTVSVSDGNGGSDTQAIAVTVTNVNEFSPVITTNGGGDTASLSAPENQTAVTDVDATDGDLQTLTYSIAGGPDATRFTIVATTGVLTFVTPPNFEAPTDAGANNVYDVTVEASDGSLTDTQAIAVTVTDVAEPAGSPLFFSLNSVATVGGVTAEDEDVVFFDGTSAFSLAFDGSDVSIGGFRIDAFSWVDATNLLLSFDTAGVVPGVTGTVDDSDIVLFTGTGGVNTAGTFSLYFDGSDVGLTTNGEDVDAVERLANGNLLISTVNSVTVSVAGEDEDLLEFVPTTLGDVTAGTFSVYFDGSDVELTTTGEDLDAAAVDADGKIYLSTVNNFAVTGVSGADEDVFVFTPSSLGATTAGTYSPTRYFDGSVFGLAANDVFAIDLP